MSKYSTFIFESYEFDITSKELRLNYSYDDKLHFTESYKFDFPFVNNIDPLVIDKAVQNIFFMAGVSYYKMYLSPKIQIDSGNMSADDAVFYAETYQKGLGEFFYVNQLDPRYHIDFPITSRPVPAVRASGNGQLIGLGGGKDSLLSTELLRKGEQTIKTWSLGHKSQLEPLVERIGLEHKWVSRHMDPQIIRLNKLDAYNGHVPISAILASVGTLVSILAGTRDLVVSNEQSANEPTLEYDGVSINHQYSKSQEFEQNYQIFLERHFGGTQRYYSLLRPFTELFIAELFAGIGFDKYHDVFSSCNSAYKGDARQIFWDGTCPKCAFVFLILTPYVNREKLELLFNGNNLLLDESLNTIFNSLLGIAGDKPLECVGSIAESRQAMRLAQSIYPELSGYKFEFSDSNDAISHLMPNDVFSKLQSSISSIAKRPE